MSEPKDNRVPIMMSNAELDAIDDWRFKNRIATRSEAIRRLCQAGIIFDREIKPAMDMVMTQIRESIAGRRDQMTLEEHSLFSQNMAISLFNAGTVFSKYDGAATTEEAIKAVNDLLRYYDEEAAKKKSKEGDNDTPTKSDKDPA